MNEQLRAIAELDRVIHEPGGMVVLVATGLEGSRTPAQTRR